METLRCLLKWNEESVAAERARIDHPLQAGLKILSDEDGGAKAPL